MPPPGLPPLNALRAFEAAARLESVSRAAAELHVTHGAVSRQVQALERELGQALFVRRGRGLAPTPAGERLRDAAGQAFSALRETWRSLHRDAARAPLVLGCPGSLLARWVIPRLERLGRDLPELRLHLSAREGDFDPALEGLDAALFLAEAPLPREWQVYELAPERIGPVLSPRYPGFARLAAAPASVLMEEALLHTASRPSAWPLWFRRNGLDPARLRLGAGFEHLYYLLEAAVAGLGVAIAPAQLVAQDVAEGRLAAPWGYADAGGRWVLCAPRRGSDERLEALATWLRQELGDK